MQNVISGARTLAVAWLFITLWAPAAVAQPRSGAPSGKEPLREMRQQDASEEGQPASESDGEQPPVEALELFNLARAHYQAGRYEQALGYLSRALEKDPGSLDLLYNIARVHELLGNLDEALVYYQRYLDALPEGAKKERGHTRETLERLRGAREHMVEPEPPPRAPPPPPGRADWLFWTTAGGSALLLGGGVFAAIVASNKDDTVRQYVLGPDGDARRRDAIASNAQAWALTADLLFLGSAATAATAALLYFLRDADAENARREALQPRLGATLAADGGGVVLTLTGSL